MSMLATDRLRRLVPAVKASESEALSKVWQPLSIGAHQLRNRVFISAHSTNFGEGHLPTDRHVAYYEERARGGASLLLTEAVRVHPTSLDGPGTIAGYVPEVIPRFRAIVDAVHDHGAKMYMQLVHTGRHATSRPVLWAPSAIPWAAGVPTPHAMTAEEIRETVSAYARCAEHAVEAGFDGVEVHLGHGHLLHQFLSPITNTRTDEYGGSEENRLRFSLDVLAAIRRAVGPSFVLGVRISGDEFLDGGLRIEDMVRLTRAVVDAVPLEFVNVSHSQYIAAPSLSSQIADMSFPSGAFLSLPREIKAALPSVAVLAACRVDDLRLAEAALREDVADMIGMTRAHIADPDLIRKAQAGKLNEIRPCIYCNQGCIAQVEAGRAITCLVNPEVGRERELGARTWSAAATPRKVLVVGGGPAGLSAARAARLRGHAVEIWEREPELGGQLRAAGKLVRRERLQLVVTFLERELARLSVPVRRGMVATKEDIDAGGFDHVIVATGSRWQTPATSGVRFVSPPDAIADPDALGPEVAICDADGGWAAFGLLEHLATQGRRAHLITPLAALAPQVSMYSRFWLLDRLKQLPVKIHALRRMVGAHDGSLELEDVTSGARELLHGVTAIVSTQTRAANDALYHELRDRGTSCTIVGDACAPRTALEAVTEGYHAGRFSSEPRR